MVLNRHGGSLRKNILLGFFRRRLRLWLSVLVILVGLLFFVTQGLAPFQGKHGVGELGFLLHQKWLSGLFRLRVDCSDTINSSANVC